MQQVLDSIRRGFQKPSQSAPDNAPHTPSANPVEIAERVYKSLAPSSSLLKQGPIWSINCYEAHVAKAVCADIKALPKVEREQLAVRLIHAWFPEDRALTIGEARNADLVVRLIGPPQDTFKALSPLVQASFLKFIEAGGHDRDMLSGLANFLPDDFLRSDSVFAAARNFILQRAAQGSPDQDFFQRMNYVGFKHAADKLQGDPAVRAVAAAALVHLVAAGAASYDLIKDNVRRFELEDLLVSEDFTGALCNGIRSISRSAGKNYFVNKDMQRLNEYFILLTDLTATRQATQKVQEFLAEIRPVIQRVVGNVIENGKSCYPAEHTGSELGQLITNYLGDSFFNSGSFRRMVGRALQNWRSKIEAANRQRYGHNETYRNFTESISTILAITPKAAHTSLVQDETVMSSARSVFKVLAAGMRKGLKNLSTYSFLRDIEVEGLAQKYGYPAEVLTRGLGVNYEMPHLNSGAYPRAMAKLRSDNAQSSGAHFAALSEVLGAAQIDFSAVKDILAGYEGLYRKQHGYLESIFGSPIGETVKCLRLLEGEKPLHVSADLRRLDSEGLWSKVAEHLQSGYLYHTLDYGVPRRLLVRAAEEAWKHSKMALAA